MNIHQASNGAPAVGELTGVSFLGVAPPPATSYPSGTLHTEQLSKSESSCTDLQVLGDSVNVDSVYYEAGPPPHHQQSFYQSAYHQQDYTFNYYEQESSRGYTPSLEYCTNAATEGNMHRQPATDEFRYMPCESEYFDGHTMSDDVHLDGRTMADDLPLFYQQGDLAPTYDNGLYVDGTAMERPSMCEASFASQIAPVNDAFPEQVPACTGTAGGVCSNSCTVCGRFYARSSTLKTHFRVHSGERPYACLQCLKRFSQAANLTAHMRIHSGEKPFLCPVCHRKFSQSSSVTTHMRTHSGERPYACSLCKKSFSDSSTLTKHFRTHSGERPYQCRVCFMRFSQSGNLNRHMKIHGQKSA